MSDVFWWGDSIVTTKLDGHFKKSKSTKAEEIKRLERALRKCQEQRDAAYDAITDRSGFDWEGNSKDWSKEDDLILKELLNE